MSGNQMSGHCRLIVLSVILLLALCATASGAATVNPNLVAYKVTDLVTVTAAPVYASCPSGYDCLTDADAAAQLGTYTKYSDAVCGYKQNTATAVAVIRVPQYCVKKSGTPATGTCPDGCSCMPESAAKDKFQGNYRQCGDSPCNTVTTAAAAIPYYCFGPGTTTTTPSGACPEGCNCISEATAKDRYGTYTRCQENPCGYEQSTATLAAVVQVPKYCIRGGSSQVCPDGCSCISDADAKLKGLSDKCDPNENPCGYQSAAATTFQAGQVPLYCYRNTLTTITPTPICPDNCGGCMSEADAKAKYGPFNYTRCADKVCGYDQSAAANYAEPKYCFGPTVTVTPAPSVCGEGCYCLQEADAKLKFGANNYNRCKPDICGYDPSAASANGIPKYCFSPAVTPAPAVCPEGCLCVTNGTAAERKFSPCGGKLTSCGYDANRQPLYCFGQTTTPACTYDYQKNVCTGTCPQGYACSLTASRKDDSGKIVYAACGCSGQGSTPCAYDMQKNACTGTCATGAGCAIVGRQVDDKTGTVTPVCGCPQQSACSYNYDKEACAGTCPATGAACQVNTIYRDATGRVTYADCTCKGAGDTCTCDAAGGACSGTCANGQSCTITERASDVAGAVVCKSCGCPGGCVLNSDNQCSGTCATGASCTRTVTKDDSGQEKVSCTCGGSQPGTPGGVATRPPGVFDGIFSFFNKLFGGK